MSALHILHLHPNHSSLVTKKFTSRGFSGSSCWNVIKVDDMTGKKLHNASNIFFHNDVRKRIKSIKAPQNGIECMAQTISSKWILCSVYWLDVIKFNFHSFPPNEWNNRIWVFYWKWWKSRNKAGIMLK